MFYVNDEPEGNFIYTETINKFVLYCIVLQCKTLYYNCVVLPRIVLHLTVGGPDAELAQAGGGGGRGDGVEQAVVLVAVRGRHAQHVLTHCALLRHVSPVQAVREHRLVVVHVQHLDVQLQQGTGGCGFRTTRRLCKLSSLITVSVISI